MVAPKMSYRDALMEVRPKTQAPQDLCLAYTTTAIYGGTETICTNPKGTCKEHINFWKPGEWLTHMKMDSHYGIGVTDLFAEHIRCVVKSGRIVMDNSTFEERHYHDILNKGVLKVFLEIVKHTHVPFVTVSRFWECAFLYLRQEWFSLGKDRVLNELLAIIHNDEILYQFLIQLQKSMCPEPRDFRSKNPWHWFNTCYQSPLQELLIMRPDLAQGEYATRIVELLADMASPKSDPRKRFYLIKKDKHKEITYNEALQRVEKLSSLLFQTFLKQRCRVLKEELMMKAWHPDRVERVLEQYGVDLNDL
jgi:hypothetical protein